MSSLSDYANELARKAEKGELKSTPEIENVKEFRDGGHCPDCKVELQMYTTKKGNSYLMAKPTPPDFCKHKTKEGKCAKSWADHGDGIEKPTQSKKPPAYHNVEKLDQMNTTFVNGIILRTKQIENLVREALPTSADVKIGMYVKIISDEMSVRKK